MTVRSTRRWASTSAWLSPLGGHVARDRDGADDGAVGVGQRGVGRLGRPVGPADERVLDRRPDAARREDLAFSATASGAARSGGSTSDGRWPTRAALSSTPLSAPASRLARITWSVSSMTRTLSGRGVDGVLEQAALGLDLGPGRLLVGHVARDADQPDDRPALVAERDARGPNPADLAVERVGLLGVDLGLARRHHAVLAVPVRLGHLGVVRRVEHGEAQGVVGVGQAHRVGREPVADQAPAVAVLDVDVLRDRVDHRPEQALAAPGARRGPP